jgi:hypothetical protein
MRVQIRSWERLADHRKLIGSGPRSSLTAGYAALASFGNTRAGAPRESRAAPASIRRMGTAERSGRVGSWTDCRVSCWVSQLKHGC